MEEHIKAIEGLIEANKKITPRSPHLNVALGCLEKAALEVQTAVELAKAAVAKK